MVEVLQPTNREQQMDLSPRVMRQIKDPFAKSQLKFMEGQFSGRVAKTAYFEAGLAALKKPDEMKPEEEHTFNKSLPKVYATLLGVADKGENESYLEGIGGIDYANLPQIGREIVRPRDGERPVMRVVFGATKTEMPLRGLDYLAIPLVMMQRMHDAGITPPQLQVIYANNISARLNGLDVTNAQQQAMLLTQIARHYIADFFPDFTDSVVFLQDTTLDRGSVARNELLSIVGKAREAVSEPIANRLQEKGINNGHVRSAMLYGAAHLLMHDTNIPGILEPIIDGQAQMIDPTTIINLGGKQEALFYGFRHDVKVALGDAYNTVKTLQLITRNHTAVYQMAQGGDIPLIKILTGNIPDIGEIAKSQQLAATAVIDLQHLFAVSGENFPRFLREIGGRVNVAA